LNRAQAGDPNAANKLLPLVYDELRKLAAARMTNEAAGHTLQPTALVHEAWLRLTGEEPSVYFANRAHFFAAAAEAMRRILVDHARRKAYGKRGGGWKRVNFGQGPLRKSEGASNTMNYEDRTASGNSRSVGLVWVLRRTSRRATGAHSHQQCVEVLKSHFEPGHELGRGRF
jgi:RNA polymerase sigma factor (TIGR02999 family)